MDFRDSAPAMSDDAAPAAELNGQTAAGAAARPRAIDSFGRHIHYLRVSLTDKCNLRCVYCMPEQMVFRPTAELLTDAEMSTALRAASMLGFDKFRLTGGEPTVRPSLIDIVAEIRSLQNTREIAMTTNGLKLGKLARPLKAAGLDRVNVSLDTVDPERFAAITRRNRLDDVLAGLAAAAAAGLGPVKVNAVLDPAGGLDDAVELLRLCLRFGYQLRIIEQMPLDADHTWQRDRAIGAGDIMTTLRQHFTLTPDPAPRGSAPACRCSASSAPRSRAPSC